MGERGLGLDGRLDGDLGLGRNSGLASVAAKEKAKGRYVGWLFLMGKVS